jgi:nucleotide-binding universal stress UspA family protein
MFNNILIPTDGSELSERAARCAIKLAQSTGAMITAFHVAPAYTFDVFEEYIPPGFERPADYEKNVEAVAKGHIGVIRKMADEARVPFAGHYAKSDFPADAILQAAERYRCDSIFMGSHGRGGVSRLLLGSQTHKVLAAATVPVVVIR